MIGQNKMVKQSSVTPLAAGLAALFFGLMMMSSCSSSDDSTGVEVPIPAVSSVSNTTLSPEDTLTVTGTNFATPASDNRVVFNNSLASAVPFAATSTRLDVLVPVNANSGGMYVTSKGAKSNKTNLTIERDVGEVWVMGGGESYGFDVTAASGSEEYLIVAHSATSTGQSFAFGVTPSTSAAYAAAPAGSNLEARINAGTPSFHGQFETRAREQAIEYLRDYRGAKKPFAPKTTAGPVAAPAPAPTETFYVLNCSDLSNCSTLDPGKFASISATLRYNGTRALIYSDDTQPTGSFTQQDYEELGQEFDSSIYPTNTSHFGTPTDIDGNGRIVILFTPRVNDLTPDGQAHRGFISGFVLLNDLSSIFPAGTTNEMEIFYSIVPDPNGEYGNVFPTDNVKDVVPGTLAHEFEHMISNGYRFVTLGSGTDPSYLQQTWLEEGMAHMAEDLNDMDGQNIARASLYLASPGPYATSILGNSELRPYNIDTLEQRGGIFLFLRYLGDQIDETIYKKIVQSKKVGIASVTDVTKTNFYTSVGDFLAALYLSGRGITSDPKYNFSSIDLLNHFAELSVANRSAGAGTFNSTVRSVGGHFNLVTGGQPPLIQFGVSSGQGSQMRVVVVRTK
jgi:hypothetical protein